MNNKSPVLHDRVALITGGSQGIGRAIALTFAEAGTDVAICARHLPNLKTVAEEIRTLGRRSLAIQADIGRSDEVNAMVKEIVKVFGGIDILVNVAFTMIASHPLMEYVEEEWDSILDTNLKGYYLCCQEVGKIMKKKKKGTIINFVGGAAVVPNPDLGAYGIAKAGVIMLTKILAIELAPYNIRVNAIGPGLVKTPGSKYLWGNPQALESYLSKSLIKRTADPREIADAALYLVSDISNFVTGHILWIDGGRLVNTR